MNCITFKNKIRDYMEGSLSFDLEKAIEEHINNCKECEEIYNNEKFVDDMFRDAFSADDIEFSGSRAEIMKKIDKNRYSKNPINKLNYHVKKYKFAYSSLAAGIVLLVVISPMLLNPIKSKNTMSSSATSKTSNKTASVQSINGEKMNDSIYANGNDNVIGISTVDGKILEVSKEKESTDIYVKLMDTTNNTVLSEVNLSKEFNGNVSFDTKFNINVSSYNTDGSQDFAIGQKIDNSKNLVYKFYSINRNKITNIAFDQDVKVFGAPEENIYSPQFESNGFNSLIVPCYNKSGILEENLYVWNRKTEKFYFEKVMNSQDEFIYMPKLKKDQVGLNIDISNATTLKDSPQGKYSAGILGKGTNAAEEGIADVILRDNENKKMFKFSLEDITKQITPKYVEWVDENNILVIIGAAYGTVTRGGDVYSININTGDISLIYKNISTREEIESIQKTDKGYKYKMNVYDDANYMESHEETGLITTTSSMPINIEMLN